MVKMTNRKIKLGINWVLKKGENVNQVAYTFDISPRRAEQLVKIFKETGKYPILNPKRRPKVYLTEDQKNIIKQAYSESYFGARMLRDHIIKRYKQKNHQDKIHEDLLELGLAKPDPPKSRKSESYAVISEIIAYRYFMQIIWKPKVFI
jgi:transposase